MLTTLAFLQHSRSQLIDFTRCKEKCAFNFCLNSLFKTDGRQTAVFLFLHLFLTLVSDEPSLTSSPENVLERAIFIDWCKSSSAGTQGADNICSGLSSIRSLISAPNFFYALILHLAHSSLARVSLLQGMGREQRGEGMSRWNLLGPTDL